MRRFTEKPNLNRAQEFVASGNYYWNSGMFLWSAPPLANAVREHVPESAPLLEKIAAAYGTPKFEEVFRELYPKCENISVDYAVLEPRSAKGEQLLESLLPSRLIQLERPSDRGRRSTRHQMETRLRGDGEGNVAETEGHMSVEAGNNYVYSPKKFVALVGVENLVIVDTEDALLIARRTAGRGQDRERAGLERADRS